MYMLFSCLLYCFVLFSRGIEHLLPLHDCFNIDSVDLCILRKVIILVFHNCDGVYNFELYKPF